MTEFEYDCLQEEQNNRKPHGGHTGVVTLPSDYLKPEELEQRNGPCRVYRLGRPMNMAEFQDLPADLRKLYLRRLRQHGGSESDVEQMLGAKQGSLRHHRVRFDCQNPERWKAFLRSKKEEE